MAELGPTPSGAVVFEVVGVPDEVLRFKQNIGLPELFKEHTFSASWE
jgi:hypothetical protein